MGLGFGQLAKLMKGGLDSDQRALSPILKHNAVATMMD